MGRELINKISKRLTISLTLIAYIALSSCFMVGPNYKEPRKPVVTHWINNNPGVNETRFKDKLWWNVFKDKNLTALIHKGYRCNLDLQSTGVRVLQARAQLAQTVGQLYPQQQALLGSYNYNRIGGTQLQFVLPTSFVTAALGATANWEIDFWGKYRRAIQGNDASFLSSYAAYDNALVTLTSDIATVYINIRTDEASIKIIKENIRVQTVGLQIAQAQFNAGQVSLLDVEQAISELESTKAKLPPVVSDLQRQKDALAVLLGTVPSEIKSILKKNIGIPKAPPQVAVGIPIETISRRPDIYQARFEAIARSEAIGAAEAVLYPAFSLAGTFAFAANNIPPSNLGQIFDWNNRNISAGPSFNWPLLNYGQLTNAVRVKDAEFQQSLLKYVNLVLKAQKEVQDNITSFIEAQKSRDALTKASHAAVKATQLAIIRYKEGENDYTTVLYAEQLQLQVQMNLVKAEGNVPRYLVGLYRSLGGGWQIRRCNDIVPRYIKADMANRTDWGTLLKKRNHQPPRSEWDKIKQLYLPAW